MTGTRIGFGQAFVLLFLCRIFTLLAAAPMSGTGGIGGGMAALAAPVSFGFRLLLFYPGWQLLRRCPGQDLAQALAQAYGRRAGKVCAFLLWLGLTVQAGLCAAEFEGFLCTAVYEDAPKFLFALLFLGAAVYGVSVGLEAVARFSTFGCALFLFLTVSLFWSLLPDARGSELFAASMPSVSVFLRTAWSFVSGDLELLCFFLLLPQIREESGETAGKGLFLWWSGAHVLTVTALLVLVTGVLGGSSGQGRAYPFYTLAMAAEGTLLARMDAVHMSVWSVLGLLRCCLLLYGANISLRCALPVPMKQGIVRFASEHRAGVTAVSAVVTMLLLGNTKLYEIVREIWRGGAVVTVLLVILPLGAACFRLLRQTGRRKKP